MAAAGGLPRAAACRFLQLLKERGRGSLLVKSNSCISTSASVLGSSWATKWSFLSSHQSLDFFLPSLSLKTRPGMSMAFVSLCLAHMFSFFLRQSEMDLHFPGPPRSCQLGCRRKCSCSEELGEQSWGFTLALIPTWIKLPIKPGYGTAPISEWLWCKQNIRILCTKRVNTSLMHTLVNGKLSHESQLAQI